MRRLLQSFLFNRKTYDRPHDEWICGRASEGCPCALGPDARGMCRATGQCLPAKRGDRWYCTRGDAQGGPCASGPFPEGACGCQVDPCVPQRNLRAQRGRWTLLAVVAALGVVIIARSGRQRSEWLNPGPLTAKHATSVERCTDCHADNATLAISPAALSVRRRADNQLCLGCHDLGPLDSVPHGAHRPELAAVAKRSNSHAAPAVLTLARALTTGGHGELACATCHQEHHGRDINLTRLNDQQCQACHATQFTSFTAGHPEFSKYPFARRTRLQFDHASHLQKHFAEPGRASAPPSCAGCHEVAGDGQLMLARGFEQSCGNCHAGQIEGEGRAGAKGIEFFRLPGVDIAALTDAGEPVGEWPKFAEGGLTPFMRWLLEGNADDRAALAALDKMSLEDLSAATPAQKTAAARLVWSVKGMLADLVTQGQPTLLQRMATNAGARNKLAARTGQMPADGLLAAQQAWLPQLLTEIGAYRRGEKPALPPRPTKPAPAPSARPAAKGDDLLGDDLLAPANSPPKAKPAASDDLLAATPPATAPSVKPADDLLLDDKPAVPSSPKLAPAPVAPLPSLKMADAEQRAAAGGWYRRDETNTLYYRPIGHADPFITEWLDATAADDSSASRAIFAELASPKAPGLCTKCHTVDATKGTMLVNWHGTRPQPNHHPFTRFKHEAHFSIAGDKGCQTCHAIDSQANYAAAFATNRDPAVFQSNFGPIDRNTCASCHTPSIAGQACLQCHNYHTGEFKPPIARPPRQRASQL